MSNIDGVESGGYGTIDWKCRICDQKGYPMILPCGHTFCDECVVRCHECAYCRQSFNISQVITNFDLISETTKKSLNYVSFAKDVIKMTDSCRFILEMIHQAIYREGETKENINTFIACIKKCYLDLCNKYNSNNTETSFLVEDLTQYLKLALEYPAKEVWYQDFAKKEDFITYFLSVINVSCHRLEHKVSPSMGPSIHPL